MNPINLIILRLVMLSIGRFFPNLIRRLLQKILIVGKNATPFSFERRLTWQSGHWRIEDSLTAQSWQNVLAVDLGCDRTSIYVVMSRTFQPGQLQTPWDLSDRLQNLRDGKSLNLTRDL